MFIGIRTTSLLDTPALYVGILRKYTCKPALNIFLPKCRLNETAHTLSQPRGATSECDQAHVDKLKLA